MFETIVWATDGSKYADSALEMVLGLARLHGSQVVAVHADEVLLGLGGVPVFADEPEIREKIDRQVAELQAEGIEARFEIRAGKDPAAKLISRVAEDVDADLIVVGTHGLGAVGAALRGSVARELTHESHRPLLVVPV